jgi:hypothetical protein
MRYLVCLILAITVVAFAFHCAKPLPSTNFDESFLPRSDYVKYIAAGNDASVAGLFWIKGLTELGESFLTGKEYAYLSHVANLCTELDSLFYTPYYFVGGVTSIDSPDTSDFVVLRRASRIYPNEWRLSLYYALRLARGPYHNRAEAANVMRKYFDSPDTTIPKHIRMIYHSFELDSMQTETALETILNDLMQPRYKKFRGSFYNKTFRILGYKNRGTDSLAYEEIKLTIDSFVDQKISPQQAYGHLLQMRKPEEVNLDSTGAVSDSTAVADTTALN